ncbi:MAG: hypothetical protein LBP79_07280 [Clostridiales bacterium]|nr:hypothetical protein [Clostridiales bacterium]
MWSYFATFTYGDDLISSEEEFVYRLKKCLSNLKVRKGWVVMGVWERGEKRGRLHFHALIYVSSGGMIGELYERKDWSLRNGRMEVTHSNTFFERVFGRCDFEKVDFGLISNSRALSYLLKYIGKSENHCFYSRGIPEAVYAEIYEDDIAVRRLKKFVAKFFLHQDVFVLDCDESNFFRFKGLDDYYRRSWRKGLYEVDEPLPFGV